MGSRDDHASLIAEHFRQLRENDFFKHRPRQEDAVRRWIDTGDPALSGGYDGDSFTSTREAVKKLGRRMRADLAEHYARFTGYSCKFEVIDSHLRIVMDKPSDELPGGEANAKLQKLVQSAERMIQEPELSFQSAVLERVIEKALQDARALEQSGHQAGFQDYGSTIRSLIDVYARLAFPRVVALCGDKDVDDVALINYYAEFSRIFEGVWPVSNDAIKVCRVFVCRRDGTFSNAALAAIAWHNHWRKEGVLPLRVEKRGRIAFEKLQPQFAPLMDKGFGFVLFAAADRRDVVFHGGDSDRYGSRQMSGSVGPSVALELFECLSQQAREYANERGRLTDLLSGVRGSFPPAHVALPKSVRSSARRKDSRLPK